jgi:hypothetical protein
MEPRHLVSCGTRGVGSQPSQRGIALVITLILLSVTLVMAIAFLAISNRERNSVTTTTDAATAKLAADSALAHAEAQIIANVFATTNPYNFGLLVSTNFINTNGFQIAPPSSYTSYTNVSYNYPNGTPLSTADNLRNLANLLYSPRPPVFVPTNSAGSNEFRFYLDLNQNGLFEDSGSVSNVDNGNNFLGTISEVGDPQWIGQLARPDASHGPNNFFVARYAFIAVPAGLDLNAIHNQVFNQGLGTADGFFRNQGVGSWEINLAALLSDLNINQWDPPTTENSFVNNPYTYQQWINSQNTGAGFEDARALLSWRYNTNYNSLATANNYFTNLLNYPYNFDSYGDGPLQTTIDTNFSYFFPTHLNTLWAGADNTNHYFNLPADLFDTSKTTMGVSAGQIVLGNDFSDRLLNAGTNRFGGSTVSTYDRYTFYRLLSQLGTDSEPEQGKINLNYSNAVAYTDTNGVVTNIVIIPNAETNLVPWTPVQFFTIAADRMLRLYTTNWFQENPTKYLATYYGVTNYYGDTNYYHVNPDFSVLTNDLTGLGLTNIPLFGMTNQVPAFGVTNIPVLVNGQFVYSSSVNRLLQLVANIYDATTNRYYDFPPSANTIPLPTVFRPIFYQTNSYVYICEFSEVTNILESDLPLSTPYDLKNPTDLAKLAQGFNRINVFGVPQIIGAKTGLPNFNQFAMQSFFEITRKLQLTRATTNSAPSTYKLNQMFAIGSGTNSGVANQLEVECWNSYYTNYTRSTDIYVTNRLTMNFTNDEGFSATNTFIISGFTNVTQWPGYRSGYTTSFLIPLNTNTNLMQPNLIYRFNSGVPFMVVDTNQSLPFETNVNIPDSITPQYPQPHWWLIVTNNIQVAMVDHLTGRLIDYVQLSGPNSARDLTAELLDPTENANLPLGTNMWLIDPKSSGILPTVTLPWGVENQLQASTSQSSWNSTSVNGFNNFVQNGLGNGAAYGSTNLEFEAYSPSATMYQTITWQANDPLVHYLAADLFDTANRIDAQSTPVSSIITPQGGGPPVFPNERYQPWGRSSQMQTASKGFQDISPFNLALKDPLIWSSDHWNFPIDKFPTVGWIGRVHRGTPWQTVFLKATNILSAANGFNTWTNWTGNLNAFDAYNAGPTQDRLLFDLFSTALNDNATRGQLSVNVAANLNDSIAGLAAWSALFSGVMVLNNNTNGLYLSTYHTKYPLLTVPSFTAFPIDPVGVNGANSPLWQLVTNINYARAHFINADGVTNAFEHMGDILSTPQLTEQSPFLNLSAPIQLTNGISDEMYEWLPQQAMSLLRCPTAPRYVVYCYGQTLKPAQNSLVTGGSSFFGMCTNYQIVSEAVVRAVIRVDDANTSHPRAVVESYNLLPPD